jgi:hypothetical protein
MNTSRFTARYLPFPQPTSNPTEPGSRFCKKRSMMGQGCSRGEEEERDQFNWFFIFISDFFFWYESFN